MSFGEKAAAWATLNIGSWRFVLGQTGIISLWFILGGPGGADPWPYIFLNLCLSLQAAYTGPVLLIAANRADAIREKVIEAIDANTRLTEQHIESRERHIDETHSATVAIHGLVKQIHDLNVRVDALLQERQDHWICKAEVRG